MSDGFESDYAGLTGYFASIHAAFDDRKITRRSVVAEGRTVPSRLGSRLRSCEFTQSRADPLPAIGGRRAKGRCYLNPGFGVSPL